jgi:hypothetical protein
MRSVIVSLVCVAIACEVMLSACQTNVTVRRRNWPQAGATSESAALAAGGVAPTPATPCGWIPESEVADLAGVAPAAPRLQGTGCFYPLASDSTGVLVTVTLPPDSAAGSEASVGQGWTEDVTRWSPPVAFAGRTGNLRIDVTATGSTVTPQQVRAIADRIRARHHTPAAAQSDTAEQVTSQDSGQVAQR